ncbi:MAG: hypothetical protein ABI867_10645 [Kofleriaceae bacterium]
MTRWILLIAVVGCGAPSGATGDDDDDGPDAAIADAAIPEGFAELVAGDWNLGAGDEGYHCVLRTLTEDVWITDFHNTAPPGTHHSALSVGPPIGPDGSGVCDAAANQPTIIYGAGVGTPDLALPAGVAVRVRAGQQVMLNLHVFNASDNALAGRSGVSIRSTTADVVEAGVANTGKTTDLSVPPGNSTQVGTCNVADSSRALSVFPHMHQLGIHMKATVTRGGTTQTLIDMPYSFDSQAYYPIAPELQLAPGDRIRVECSYQNTTGATVGFGQSSLQEMCGLGIYVSPPWNNGNCGF